MSEIDWELKLGYLIHDVSRLRRNLFDQALSPLGVTRSQWWVLAFLSRNDGMVQTELARELDLGKVALGGLIDRLEKTGSVERRPDPNDRRVKRIFLTPESKKLINRMRRQSHRTNELILSGIDPKDLGAVTDVLEQMKTNLLAALGKSEEAAPAE